MLDFLRGKETPEHLAQYYISSIKMDVIFSRYSLEEVLGSYDLKFEDLPQHIQKQLEDVR